MRSWLGVASAVVVGLALRIVWVSIVLVDPNQDNPTRRVHLGFLSG